MNAREFAWNVLKRVITEGGYASLIMRQEKSFSREDQNLISELVYGVLRNYDYLSYQWQDLAKKRVKKNNVILLNMGCYQLLFLDRIPTYAAIDETVALANRHDRGFINALLREVERNGRKEIQEKDPLKHLAIETSHPLWLLNLWNAHYGLDKTIELAHFNNTRAYVYGRRNPLTCSLEELTSDAKVKMINEIAFQYDGNLVDSDWFKNGKVLIQDLASQQIVEKMQIEPGMMVMDCCCAPGTKAQYIASFLQGEGKLYASDLSETRMQLVKQLMEKTGVKNAICFTRDACIPMDLPEMDAILCDVPCSGLGDLRHKPEIKYHLQPENIDTLVNIQKRILDVNASYCKVGGILMYSTCTLNKKENENQIQMFLNTHPMFQLEEEKTIFPMEMQSDGFYLARMRRIHE